MPKGAAAKHLICAAWFESLGLIAAAVQQEIRLRVSQLLTPWLLLRQLQETVPVFKIIKKINLKYLKKEGN